MEYGGEKDSERNDENERGKMPEISTVSCERSQLINNSTEQRKRETKLKVCLKLTCNYHLDALSLFANLVFFLSFFFFVLFYGY